MADDKQSSPSGVPAASVGADSSQHSSVSRPVLSSHAQPPHHGTLVPQVGSTLTQPFALKLDRHNFSVWKTMVSAIVRGHHLDGYLTGTKVKPAEFLSSDIAGGDNVVNPEFETWIIHDQLLLGWLYGSMTESIATEVMSCDTSAALWTALETLFGAHSRSKMDEVRTKIQTVRKGGLTMSEYLRQKRQWADVLTLAGEPYPEKQLVANVLSGLDMEYISIVVLIEARPTTSWQELQDILLSFDSKMERLSAISGSQKAPGAACALAATTAITANMATTRPVTNGRNNSQYYSGNGNGNRGTSSTF
ncbi:uncharacterized protein LOC133780651 [Humulus lupulus]|uniref:uncharacterized protein LOC133780651 n=1 Tax=Humulus lupulus TaxID=3486 RepID=UPI002B40BCBD|nr:uncharacterized protein LOC133780651 [Humulus lupulus]